jgi:hypothetical protein
MKFSIYKLDGTLVEFRASWYHERFKGSRCIKLPVTERFVRRAQGITVCTFTPTINGEVLSNFRDYHPLAQGDAACSASEPDGYSKQRGRIMSFGSALRVAGFNRVKRSALWQQYWEQQGCSGPSLRKRQ